MWRKWRKYYNEKEYYTIVLYDDKENNKVYYLKPKIYEKSYQQKEAIYKNEYVLIKYNWYDKIVFDVTKMYCMDRDYFIDEYRIDPSQKNTITPKLQQYRILKLLIQNYNKDEFLINDVIDHISSKLWNKFRSQRTYTVINNRVAKFNNDFQITQDDPYFIDTSILKLPCEK